MHGIRGSQPLRGQPLRTATVHGPAGKLELREDEYWQREIEWLSDAAGGSAVTPPGVGPTKRLSNGARAGITDRAAHFPAD